MNKPNDFPLPDLVDAGAIPFPFLAADDPAVRTVESPPYPIPEFGDATPPALDAAHFSPPQMNDAASAGPASPLPPPVDEEPGFAPALLGALAADPIAARTLEHLRMQIADKLAALTDEACSMLASGEKSHMAKPLPSGPTNIRKLMSASRNSEIEAKNHRELAEVLVMGSVMNLGNANWDPTDPASSAPAENNLIYGLLQMEM